MSNRANIYEKYQKSDIFNLNPPSNNCEPKQNYTGRYTQSSILNTQDNINSTIDPKKSINQRIFYLVKPYIKENSIFCIYGLLLYSCYG